ncbi:MarR family transcriptional regulator [Dietzia maris]
MIDSRLGPSERIARDLRAALRPLRRRFNSHETLSVGKVGVFCRHEQGGSATASDLPAADREGPQFDATVVPELEGLGLLIRTPEIADRRCIRIELTGEGRSRLGAERLAGQGWLVRAVAEQLDDDRATLEAAVPLPARLGAEIPRELD